MNRARLSSLQRALAAVGALIVLTACAPAPPPGAVFVHAAPPPAPRPVPSSLQNIADGDTDRRAWIGGHYQWNGSEYVWVPGRWEKPPHPGAVWVNGLWAHARNGWYWVEGRWR
jgi:hypothetical protein